MDRPSRLAILAYTRKHDTGDIDELMSVLQRGDRLGVSELPPARVGRWVFAEAERDLISESTREGLARAKSSGSSP